MPAGLLLAHLTGYRDLLAACPTFRRMVGPAVEPEDRVFLYRETAAAYDVWGVIADTEQDTLLLTRHSTGAGLGAFSGTRSSHLIVYQRVAAFSATAAEAFLRDFALIMEELLERAGTGDHPLIRELRKLPCTNRPDAPLAFCWQDESGPGYQLGVQLTNGVNDW